MDSSPSSAGPALAADVAHVRSLVSASTGRLLERTATVGDPDWPGPSRLPGWSRAHVATHLARQADALGRLSEGALTGRPQAMYASPEQRDADIEAGADRPGAELQLDLKAADVALAKAMDALAAAGGWDRVVELRGGDQVPARVLPLARLSEVVLHHVDLDVGFDAADVDEATAELLLPWCAFRLRRRADFPRLQLLLPSGAEVSVGSLGEPARITGQTAQLLGWLTGRSDGQGLTGATGTNLPPFG